MSLVDVVDGEVELEGGEDVAAVDRHLVLASHQGGVHVGQLLFQLALQEEKVVGWRVPVGDGGSQELMWIILHRLEEDLFTISIQQEEGAVATHFSTLDTQGAALGGLEGEAHGLSLLLHFDLELLMPGKVV